MKRPRIRSGPGPRPGPGAPKNTSHLVLGGEENWNTNVTGTSPEYFAMRDWEVASGVPVSDSDVANATKVAVLGQTVVDKLFESGRDIEGQTIRINNVPFDVVGVLEKKGQSPMGQDYEDTVIVPESTYSARISGGADKFIMGAIGADRSGARGPRESTAPPATDRRLRGCGDTPDIDLAQVRTEIANARVQLINAENGYATSRARLMQAIGLEGVASFDVADDSLAPVEGEDRSAPELFQQAVKARPDLAQLASQIRAQALTASRARVSASRRPRLPIPARS